jgi:hypothetical protein
MCTEVHPMALMVELVRSCALVALEVVLVVHLGRLE